MIKLLTTEHLPETKTVSTSNSVRSLVFIIERLKTDIALRFRTQRHRHIERGKVLSFKNNTQKRKE
jgi:hypothetical protein